MNPKVILLIIYNHRFDRNIKILNELYEKKFSCIYHVIPFYDGNEENVLPVYESSFNFSGYISQAKVQLDAKGLRFEHYFIVADDMILNPIITEKTYHDIFKLNSCTSFIPFYQDITKSNYFDWRGKDCIVYSEKIPGVEIENILPSNKVSMELLKRHNVIVTDWKWYHFIPNIKHLNKYLVGSLKVLFKTFLKRRSFKLLYPLVGGYSDIVIVSSSSIDKFCLYAGCFAATNLFVEFAIPTSLLLSSDCVVCEKDLNFRGGTLWTKDDFKILDKYNYSIQQLLNDFPFDYLYLHPIKLSKWK